MNPELTVKGLAQEGKEPARKYAGNNTPNNSKRLHKRYLEAIIDSTNLPIYLKGVDFKYIFINSQFERLAHVASEQVTGKDDFAIFPEPIARVFRTQDEEVIRRKALAEFEETIPLPDGIRTFMTAKFPLFDSRGIMHAVAGVCTDITAYKKTQVELKVAEEKYRGIFENSPLGILHLNADGIITATNEKLAEILDSTPEKIIGFDLKRSKQKEVRLLIASVLSGKTTPYEGYYLSATGSGRVYLCGAFSPIFADDQSVAGAIGIIENATRRRQAEEELQKAHDNLEQRVAERTVQLDQKTAKLMDTNIALKILLEKRNEDKREMEEKVISNIEKLIYPYLEKLEMKCNGNGQKTLVEIILANLEEITSSFDTKHNNLLASLTPAQLQIANLIKHGMRTKEIASMLDLSPSTIACHRQEIRKRLCLNNKKMNLQTALTLI